MTFHFRLYPKRSQLKTLEHLLDLHRELYNAALEERREAWKRQHLSISYCAQANQLKAIRSLRPDVAALNYSSCQQTLRRLDQSFQNFFRRVQAGEKAGYPRFKASDRFNTVEFVYGDGCKLEDDLVYFQTVGRMHIVRHRELQGSIKRCAFTRRAHKWYLNVTCEIEAESPAVTPLSVVGIDVGLESFATLSTGEKIANPRFFRRAEKDLKRAQRQLSKRARGTKERQHAKKVVSRIHERIANRRSNFAHQHSRQIANRFGLVVFEDLAIRNMQANHTLAKSRADAAWNQFVTFTRYKVEKTGGAVVPVDPRGTSQLCSACGEKVVKDLSARVHVCPACGLTLDRDHNAALNILARGRASLGLPAVKAAGL